MAYIYIPCIILEIICIGIRIANYGLTETRYMAIAAIIFFFITHQKFMVAPKVNDLALGVAALSIVTPIPP